MLLFNDATCHSGTLDHSIYSKQIPEPFYFYPVVRDALSEV